MGQHVVHHAVEQELIHAAVQIFTWVTFKYNNDKVNLWLFSKNTVQVLAENY